MSKTVRSVSSRCRRAKCARPAIAQAAYAVAVLVATELLTSGTYDSAAGGIAYDPMNDAITPDRGRSGKGPVRYHPKALSG